MWRSDKKYQKCQKCLFFNIFICNLLFEDININLANYEDYTPPLRLWSWQWESNRVTWENFDKLFDWFLDNVITLIRVTKL